MSLDCVKNSVVTNTVNIPSCNSSVPVSSQVSSESDKSNTKVKTLLTMAMLGAVTYGLFRYTKAKSLAPIVQNFEKTTKDGGKFTQQIFKNQVRNPNGTTEERMVKTIKSQFDKNGLKRGEVIHDYEKRECYTVLFDKTGKVYKQIVRRMSEPNMNGKCFVEQSMTHSIIRDAKYVTTEAVLQDFSSGKPQVLMSSRFTNLLKKSDT